VSRWRELWLYFWRDLMIARTYRNTVHHGRDPGFVRRYPCFFLRRRDLWIVRSCAGAFCRSPAATFAFALVGLGLFSTTWESQWTHSIKA